MSCDEPALCVTNIGKAYHIYPTPRARLKQFVLPMLRSWLGLSQRKYFKEFWALKNVSFQVRQGEALGIIGRNGSGKSTLLQIVCGTLSPSEGQVQINGRVAALLELGAGFNPEFTGRDNVYMAASLYGLSREEIDARFTRIARFADIGDHLEQPVKTYSSGMYVRLAFAVIAHVDADILVIDEALSVGDAVFTQKCMRFIRRFRERGTLIFVSHDMNSVLSFCDTALWLDGGVVRGLGPSKNIAEDYLQFTLQEIYGEEAILKNIKSSGSPENSIKLSEKPDSERQNTVPEYQSMFEVECNLDEANGWKSGAAEILSVHVQPVEERGDTLLQGGELVRMVIRAVAHQDLDQPILGFLVRDRLSQDLFGENTLSYTDLNPVKVRAGERFEGSFVFQLPMLPNGQYVIMASLAEGSLQNHIQHHWLHDAMVLTVSSSKVRFGLVGVKFDSVALDKIA